MAENRIILELSTGIQVLSGLLREDLLDGRTLLWITSTIGGAVYKSCITLPANPAYSGAQMEYDIEIARWKFAAEAGGAASVRQLAGDVLVPVEGEPETISGGPRYQPPSSG